MSPRKIVSQILLTLPLGAALLLLSAASSDAQLVPSNIINATGSTSNAMTSVGLGSVSSTLSSVTDILDEVNAYGREIQGFYQNLVGGGLNGILNDVSTLEGVLGIPDPNAVQSQIYTTTTNGSETDTTFSTIPTNNHEAIMAYPGRITAANGQITQGVTESIMGKQGQQLLQQQQQQMQSAVQQTSSLGQDAVSQAQGATSDGQTAGSFAQEAQGKNVTQDVMKDTAMEMSSQASQTSHLANLTADTAQMTNQTNAEIALMSQQVQGLEIGQAATNLELTNIDGDLSQMNSVQENEKNRADESVQQSGEMLYIPGLQTQ